MEWKKHHEQYVEIDPKQKQNTKNKRKTHE